MTLALPVTNFTLLMEWVAALHQAAIEADAELVLHLLKQIST
jgi:hypothetical protein